MFSFDDVCAPQVYTCVCFRKRMIVFVVRTYVCALGEHLCLLMCAHMSVPRVHTCALIAHAVFLDTYLRCSGIHMCVPRVHTCVSELDTRFTVFQVNTHVFST